MGKAVSAYNLLHYHKALAIYGFKTPAQAGLKHWKRGEAIQLKERVDLEK